jgi:hypothetical protein
MPYTITKTDGSELTKIVDGTIDQTSTDITLIGKNASAYGKFIDQNFVSILENFANSTPPSYPITGQLWYDTSEGRLKVYDPVGGGFKVSGGTIVAASAPSSLTTGDIWINSYSKQLYFNDGSATFLAGPLYTAQQGISGFNVVTILDTSSVAHTIIYLYVAQVLLGIWSSTAFTPLEIIPGYGSYVVPEGQPNAGATVSNPIIIGFNASAISGEEFNVTATRALGILSTDGQSVLTAGNFLSSTENTTTAYGSLQIQGGPTNVPLVLGPSLNNKISVNSQLFSIAPNGNQAVNQNFEIATQPTSAVTSTNFFIDASNQRVGINTNSPQIDFDVAGDAQVRGSLTVSEDTHLTGKVIFASTSVPSTVISAGVAGQVAWDSSHFYVCIAANSWKRCNLSTW